MRVNPHDPNASPQQRLENALSGLIGVCTFVDQAAMPANQRAMFIRKLELANRVYREVTGITGEA